jgi:hypothetical protein
MQTARNERPPVARCMNKKQNRPAFRRANYDAPTSRKANSVPTPISLVQVMLPP